MLIKDIATYNSGKKVGTSTLTTLDTYSRKAIMDKLRTFFLLQLLPLLAVIYLQDF